MIAIRAILFVFLLTTFALAQQDERVPLPQNAAVLGDSISEGMFSEFNVEHPPTFGQVLEMVNLFTEYTGSDRMLAFRKAYAKSEHSWAMGESDTDPVLSHAERLRIYRPNLKAFNFAVSGAKSSGLDLQVAKFLETEEAEDLLIDYVTVFIGANDLKGKKLDEMVMPFVYENNVEFNLRRILEKNPHRMLLIVGLPHIMEVFEKSAKMSGYSILGIKIKCKDMRQTLYGKNIIFNPEHSDYGRVKMVAQMYTDSLKRVAAHLKEDYPAAYVKAIYDYDAPGFNFRTLSSDCFHPSTWGQALISEMTWAYGFWPDLVSPEDLLKR